MMTIHVNTDSYPSKGNESVKILIYGSIEDEY